jgi:hypothetical protein
MINLEQVMKTYRTSVQWQQLLQQRSMFSGTNVEFCQHHNVAITTYYKQRALLAEYQPNSTLPVQTTNPTLSRFIQVKQTTIEVCEQTHQHPLQFDIHTGQLMLPANLATTVIVAIIKGLTV